MTAENAASDASVLPAILRKVFVLIATLSVVGAIVSAISLQRHFAKSATAFCDFAQKFNCDIVNRSEQSIVMGIPVAAIGVAGYGLLFVLSTYYRSRAETPIRLLIASVAGLIFALYLTYVEAFELDTWCILCLSSSGLIAAITVLAATAKARFAKTDS